MITKVVPQDTFDNLQIDAGVLLKSFDITNPAVTDENLISATTGGITIDCKPSYSDFFEDVDNVPNNTKEGKHLDGWDCKVSTTTLSTSVEGIKFALGAADVVNDNSVVPRSELKQADFGDLWWVGDRADGGLVAVKIRNALSTGGFSLKTGKNAKGNVTIELTGHVSITDQDTMPMIFYSLEP